MLGFKRFRNAAITLAGIELMHHIRKGQFNLATLGLKDTYVNGPFAQVFVCYDEQDGLQLYIHGLVPGRSQNGSYAGIGFDHEPRLKRATPVEHFKTSERVFAWEDKFLRLLLRFERLSPVHYAIKTLAYTMINLRHYGCSSAPVRAPWRWRSAP